jgi:hypothetical protein
MECMELESEEEEGKDFGSGEGELGDTGPKLGSARSKPL